MTESKFPSEQRKAARQEMASVLLHGDPQAAYSARYAIAALDELERLSAWTYGDVFNLLEDAAADAGVAYAVPDGMVEALCKRLKERGEA